MTDIDLDKLREALAKATPGRWFVERPENGGRVLANDARRTIIHGPSCSPFNVTAQADAALIALAPTLAAAYLVKCQAVEAAEAEMARLKDVVRLGINVIDGDAVGAEWKRQCNVFLRHALAALRARLGEDDQ